MNTNELIAQVSALLEQSGVKEQLKKQETIEAAYDFLAERGLNIDKETFVAVVKSFTNDGADFTPEKLIELAGAAGGLGKLAEGIKGLGGLFK